MDKTLHLGKMIQAYIDSKNYKRTTVAQKAGVFNTTIYAFEKRASMQTTTLLRLTHALKYNFFMDIANSIPAEYDHGQFAVSEREALISQLQEENKKLKFENELMKELMLGRKSWFLFKVKPRLS